jgi:hypothetical protein
MCKAVLGKQGHGGKAAGYTSVQYAAVICLLLDHGGVCDDELVAEHLANYISEEPSVDAAEAVLRSMVAADAISITPRSPYLDHMTDPSDDNSQVDTVVTAPSHLQLYVWRLKEATYRARLREWDTKQVGIVSGIVSYSAAALVMLCPVAPGSAQLDNPSMAAGH